MSEATDSPPRRTMPTAALPPERADLPSPDIGSDTPSTPGSFAAIDRLKARLAGLDQAELTEILDREVEAVRAGHS